MDLLVLNPTVLTMVGRYRADVFGVPAQGDNDAIQHYAYHQFVLWQHGKLGIGNRHVILSCCVCGKLDRQCFWDCQAWCHASWLWAIHPLCGHRWLSPAGWQCTHNVSVAALAELSSFFIFCWIPCGNCKLTNLMMCYTTINNSC